MSCPHSRQQGDNYGITCMDCGEVIEGYGFWAEGSNVCSHRWMPLNENEEVCMYCESIRGKEE